MNRRAILSFAVGPVVAAGLSFLSLPLIAWFFSPEDVGRNNVFQVFSALTALICVLGLDQAYVREFHESADRFRLFRACFLPGFILLGIAFVISLPFAGKISGLLFGSEVVSWYVLTACCIVLGYMERFLALVVRMQERGLAYSCYQVLPKIITISLLGIYVLFGASPVYTNLLYVNLAASVVMVLVLLWNTRLDVRPVISARMEADELKRLLRFGAPLVGAGLAYWGLSATSTVVLRTFSDFREIGIYSMGMSLAGVGLVFQGIFSTVWMPTVYKWVAKGEDLGRVDVMTGHVFVAVCFIFAVTGMLAWAVDFILPAEYGSVKYIVPCCIAQPLLYTLSETTVVGLNIRKKTAYALGIAVAALLTNLALSIALVPRHGAAGAAVANAGAYVVFFVARTEVSVWLWRPIRRARMYAGIVALVGLAASTALNGPRTGLAMESAIWLLVFVLLVVVHRSNVAILVRNVRTGMI